MLHSLLCGLVVAVALLVPWRLLREPVPDVTRNWIAGTVGVVAVLVLLMVRKSGLRALHFATLVPLVLALGFLLRFAAPVLDQTLSARSVNAELDARFRQHGTGSLPLAIFDVKKQRDLAYGLNFYRSRPVTYYESDGPRDLPHGVPPEAHVVITKMGNGDAVQAVVGPRAVKSLGGFRPQNLEFFLVADAKTAQSGDPGR
jgi:hypothetical protein